MRTALRRGYDFFKARPILRLLVQACVSLVILWLLLATAQSSNVLASLQSIKPSALLLGFAIQLIGFLLSILRWKLLLEHLGVRERYRYLVALYFIGMFCSLFLPTGSGGDAVRAYNVGQRSGKLGSAVTATLQERLIGLGTSLMVGLVATLFFLGLLPEQLRPWALLIQIVGVLGVILLIYPAALYQIGARAAAHLSSWPQLRGIADRPLIARIAGALRGIGEIPPVPLPLLAKLLVLTFSSTLLGIALYYVIGQSLSIEVAYLGFCLVVPLVWIARMAPISLGGLGVAEGSFAFLMGLFAVSTASSLALALGVLGVQTSFALLGGSILLVRMIRGERMSMRPTPVPASDQ